VKKRILFLFTFLLLPCSVLFADLIRIEAGAGAWLSDNSGTIEYKGSPIDLDDVLGLKDTTSPYLWLNFKHFLPVIPNARVEMTKMEYEATEKISKNFKFGGQMFNAFDDKIDSTLNLDQIDVIFYYNFLDNLMWLTLDLGVGVKYYSGYLEIKTKSLMAQKQKIDIDFPIPMIYGRVGAKIPFTDIGAEMDIKYFKFKEIVDAEMIDLRIKADISLLDLFLIDLHLEAGYRVQRLMIDSADSSFSGFQAKAKTESEGFFAGLSFKF
jgi:outer membrane protein